MNLVDLKWRNVDDRSPAVGHGADVLPLALVQDLHGPLALIPDRDRSLDPARVLIHILLHVPVVADQARLAVSRVQDLAHGHDRSHRGRGGYQGHVARLHQPPLDLAVILPLSHLITDWERKTKAISC